MARSQHGHGLRRKEPRLQQKQRLLIVCEGKITEPCYFRSLVRVSRNNLVDVDILPEAGVPKTLVQYAVERKKQAEREAKRARDPYLKYDEVWCVFDVDEHPNLAEAKQQARDNGCKVAISNPCFELWVLLHFQDQRAEQHRHATQRACAGHISGYEKEIPFDKIHPFYDDALRRAQELDHWQQTRNNAGANPSTGVYFLTETIRKFGKDQFLKQTVET
jgi:hypothetical protein